MVALNSCKWYDVSPQCSTIIFSFFIRNGSSFCRWSFINLKFLELMYTAGKRAAMMAGMNQVVVLKFSGLRSRWNAGERAYAQTGLQHFSQDSQKRWRESSAVIRLSNRKRFIFQQKYVIDTTNDLRNFLRPHRVWYIFYRCVLFFSHDPICVVLQISSQNSPHHECSCCEEIRYLPQDNGPFIDGWVCTCNSKIMNLQTLLRCSGKLWWDVQAH